jgi:DNA-binding PadR family transcriptional regulator
MNIGDTSSLADLPARHRDLLWVLSQTGPSESHTLKHVLESYYNKTITDDRIITTLSDLTTHDLVVKRSHDNFTTKYHLTDPGRRALQARLAWQANTNGGDAE